MVFQPYEFDRGRGVSPLRNRKVVAVFRPYDFDRGRGVSPLQIRSPCFTLTKLKGGRGVLPLRIRPRSRCFTLSNVAAVILPCGFGRRQTWETLTLKTSINLQKKILPDSSANPLPNLFLNRQNLMFQAYLPIFPKHSHLVISNPRASIQTRTGPRYSVTINERQP